MDRRSASGGGTSYLDENLSADIRYCYQIRTVGGSLKSEWTDERCDTTERPPVTPPPPPDKVRAAADSWDEITITWDASAGATGYRIRMTGTEEDDVRSTTRRSYTWSGLDGDTRYCFDVQATNAGGGSSWSTDCARTPVQRPPTPTGIGAEARSDSEIRITWRAAARATEYTVRREDNGETRQTPDTLLDWTGLSADTEYCFEVRASNTGGASAWSSRVCDRTLDGTPDPPPTPTEISAATQSSSEITISWRAAAGATEYEVRRRDNRADTRPTADTEYTWTGLSADTEYCFEVRASNAGGASPWSTNRVCDTTLDETPDPPPTPEDISAAAQSSSAITISWRAAARATEYEVRRRDDRADTRPAADTEYTWSGLSADTEYCFEVRASNAGGDSAWSTSRVCDTTFVDLPEPPPPPEDISAAAQSSSAITISWRAAARATEYEVRRRDDRADTRPTADTEYTWSGLSADTEYCFEVRASNAGGDSAWSGAACGTTFIETPDPPTGFDVSASSSSVIELSWNGVSGADSYEFQRRPSAGSYPPEADAVDVGDVTDHRDTGLSAETRYCYQVRTVVGSSQSRWTVEQCATTEPPIVEPDPEPPTNFTATAASPTAIELSWTPVSAAVDGYQVRYKRMDLTTWGSWRDAETESGHTVTGLQPETWYDFEVWTVRGAERSDPVSASARTEPPMTPRPPRNLKARARSSSAIGLSWEEVPGAAGYRLQRKQGPGGSWGSDMEPDGETSHEDGGLSAGVEYCYRVKAVGVTTDPVWSGVVCRRTKRAAPANFRVTEMARRSATVAWDASPGADRYRLYTPVVDFPVDGTSYQFQGMEPGTSYEFAVSGMFGGAESERSGTLTLTTPDPVAPGSLEAVAGATEVSLSWGAGSGVGTWEGPGGSGSQELGYKVERRSPAGAGDWELLAEGLSALEYGDATVTVDTEYEYRVRSMIAIPGFTIHSPNNPTRTVVTSVAMLPVPENLRVTGLSGESVDLAWDASPGATGYRVTRDGMETAATGAMHTEGSLVRGVTYEFTVAALFDGTPSAESGVLTVTTADPQPPAAAPAASVGEGAIMLSWTVGSGAGGWSSPGGGATQELGYAVERRTPPDSGSWAEIASGLSATEYEDDSVTAGLDYEYRVRTTIATPGGAIKSSPGPATPVMAQGLAKPKNVSVTVVSSVALRVSWDAVEGADGYEVEWTTNGGSGSVDVGSETAYDHPDLTPETTYSYRVRAQAGSGPSAVFSDWSDAVSDMTEVLPVPGNLTAMGSSATSVRLSWDAVGEADRYDLERMRMDDQVVRVLQLPDAETSYEDTGLLAGKEYMYKVRSVVVRSGTEYPSAWSAPPVTVRPAPPVPELTAEAVSAVRVDVSWTSVPAATGYELEWRTDETDWTSLVSGTDLRYEHEDLAPGTAYWYRVRVQVGSGPSAVYSEWSDGVSDTTEVLPVPGNLMAMGTSPTAVRLSWDAVEEADRYHLERMRMDDQVIRVLQLPDAETSYEDTGLLAGKEYMYKVRSVVVRSETEYRSPWSAAVAVTPMLVPPENVTATAPDAVTVELSWDAVPGAAGYRFRWQADGGPWTLETEDVTGTAHPHEDRDPSTVYTYEVLSYLGTDESEWSMPAAVTTPVLPAPADVEASATATAVRVSWSGVAVADGYQVRRQVMPEGGYTVNPVSETAYTDRAVEIGVEYMYQVRSVVERPEGEIESAWSAPVTATPTLLPPENLEAAAASATVITLAWDASEGAAGYEFHWRTGDGAWSEALDAGSGTSQRHEGLEPETEYTYEVRAVSGTHRSDWSDPDSATTEEDTGPPVPAGLTLTADSPFAVTAEWAEVPVAERYELRWRETGEPAWQSLELTGESHENTELTPDTTYEYEVRSVRGAQVSAWSDTEDVTTLAFAAPGNFTATATGPTEVELNWDVSPGTSIQYRLRWRPVGGDWSRTLRLTETSHTATRLTAATEYQFRVVAYRRSADGEWHRSRATNTRATTPAE